MTAYGPPSAFLLVGGNNISGDTFQAEESVEQVMEQTNGLGDSWEESLPVGIAKVMLSAGGGIYDDRTAGIVSALQSKGTTRQLVSFGVSGITPGSDVSLLDGDYAAKWHRIAARDGLTKANAEHVITGQYYRGRLIHGLSAETTSTGNSQATSVDATLYKLPKVISNSTVANPTVLTSVKHGLTSGDTILIAGSTTTPTLDGSRVVTAVDADTFTIPVNVSSGGAQTATWTGVTTTGAIVDLHVPALTLGGWTDVTFILRDSADNSTFANVTGGTFTNVSAVAANQRLTIAGQVRRYMALQWTFNGAGSGQSVMPVVGLWRP